jgi:hypothetical protein
MATEGASAHVIRTASWVGEGSAAFEALGIERREELFELTRARLGEPSKLTDVLLVLHDVIAGDGRCSDVCLCVWVSHRFACRRRHACVPSERCLSRAGSDCQRPSLGWKASGESWLAHFL